MSAHFTSEDDAEFARLTAEVERSGGMDEFAFDPKESEKALQAELAKAAKFDLGSLNFGDDVDMTNMEFDEGDLDDPELLKELAEMAGEQEEDQDLLMQKRREEEINSLKQQIKDSGKKALDHKHSGNKDAAREVMQHRKLLKQRLADVENGGNVWKQQAQKNVESVGQRLNKVEALKRKGATALGVVTSSTIATKEMIEERLKQYTNAAKVCKGAGRNEEAKTYLQARHQLQEALELTESGLDVIVGDLPEEIAPIATVPPVQKPKPTPPPAAAVASAAPAGPRRPKKPLSAEQIANDEEAKRLEEELLSGEGGDAIMAGGQTASTEDIEERLAQYNEAAQKGKEDYSDSIDLLKDCLEMSTQGMEVDMEDLPPALKKSSRSKSKRKSGPSAAPVEEALAIAEDRVMEDAPDVADASKELIQDRLRQYEKAAKKAGGGYDEHIETLKGCLNMVEMDMSVGMDLLPPPLSHKHSKSKSPKSSHSSSKTSSHTEGSKYASLEEIEKRKNAFTQKARKYKGDDRMEEAKECLRKVMTLEKLEKQIKSGQQVKLEDLPSKHHKSTKSSQSQQLDPSQSSKDKKKKKSKHSTTSSADLGWVKILEDEEGGAYGDDTYGDDDVEMADVEEGGEEEQKTPKKKKRKLKSKQKLEYENLANKLKTQIDELDAESKRLLRAKDKNNALIMHRAKKASVKDFELLEISREKKYPPPTYKTIQRDLMQEFKFDHLQPTELEITIEKCTEIFPPKGYTDIDGYVEVAIEIPTGNVQKVTTQTEKGLNPIFNFVKRFKFQRSRAASRKFKFLKVDFSVYHNRAFFRDVLIGQTSCKLKDLVAHAEHKTVLQMRDKNRKNVGKLDVIFRLSTPIEGKDIRKIRREHIILDEFSASVESPKTERLEAQRIRKSVFEREEQKSASPKPSHSAPSAASSSSSSKKKSAGKSSKSSSSASLYPLPKGITQEMVDNPHSPELLISNEVMQHAIDTITQQITDICNKGKRPSKNLLGLKAQILVNQNKLVEEVQSGTLTMDAYLVRLKPVVLRDKRLALVLNKRGQKSVATTVLQRAKIMQAEIEGAENAAK